MKFIKQTKFLEEGNCLEACISSLTDIPIEDFPNLKDCENGAYWKILNNWLIKEHSIYIEPIKYDNNCHIYNRGLIIAIGKSPRSNDLLHAVLWDLDKNKVLFDPSSNNIGIAGNPQSFAIIVKHYNMDIAIKCIKKYNVE